MAKVGDICFIRGGPNARRLCVVIGPHVTGEYTAVTPGDPLWEVRTLQTFRDIGGFDVPPGTEGVACDSTLIPLPGLPADESESIERPIPAEVA
jgi:hypothetical protein